jgi:hypothetical protein
MDRIHAASSRPLGTAQGFRSTQGEGEQREVDWMGAMDGASFDTHSAYLLAAVAVEHGEIPPESLPAGLDFSLKSALQSARTELAGRKAD